MSEPKRWKEDAAFVEWLRGMRYLEHTSEALKVYMWEAFKGGEIYAASLRAPRA